MTSGLYCAPLLQYCSWRSYHEIEVFLQNVALPVFAVVTLLVDGTVAAFGLLVAVLSAS